MATASEIITDALIELLVQSSEQAIESAEMQSAIRYLNRMMSEWAARGMSLGFTNIVNPGDTVTVPDGALGAVVSNLAMKLAKQYDEPVTQDLLISAKDGIKAVLHLTVHQVPTSHPSTLPIGSGNENWGLNSGTDRNFYPEQDETAQTEAERNINLESDT